jgi:hypothetical protein
MLKSLLVKSKWKFSVFPGWSDFFWNPRSCFNGAFGIPTYNCATSAAVTWPELVIRQSAEARFSNRDVIPPDSTGEGGGRYDMDVFAIANDINAMASEE